MSEAGLLVRGAAHLLTGRAGAAARARGGNDLRVRDGVIAAIGTLPPQAGERVIDASGCVIYPGWVNTHHHLFQSLLKGIPAGINLALVPWLAAVPVRYRRFFDHEHALRIAARVGLVELVLSGCTTVADHQYHYYPDMPFDASAAVFDEAERLGVRMVLCRGGQTVPRVMSDGQAPPQAMPETLESFLASVERDVQRFHDPGPRAMRRVVSAITTPNWSCKPDHLKPLAREARRLGIRLHSHLSETHDYVTWARDAHRCTPMQFVAEHEWVGDDVWYAHMVHLNDDEVAFCATSGTGIAHCPQSNARLGSGIARVPELLAAGAQVGLAVDGAASNEAADMLSEAHACWLLHRADPRAGPRRDVRREGGDAAAMTAEEVVRIGTAGGASLLGLAGVGTLEVGMAADFAVYDLSRDPRFFGLHDTAVAPVVSGARPALRALLVDGRVVVEHDRIPGLDLEQLRRDAQVLVEAMRDA
ncbi:MAG TPA: amidohydrolase family protein [Burkholderiaceae bacterium]|nr:amidohydrolase family protein [Burkholderiaceae bacterium]